MSTAADWEERFRAWEKVAREPEEGAEKAADIRREYFERKRETARSMEALMLWAWPSLAAFIIAREGLRDAVLDAAERVE